MDGVTEHWTPIYGIKAVADRYCGGNYRRAELLIQRGIIKRRKVGKRLSIFDPVQIEKALKEGLA